MAGIFEITQAKDGDYHFHLKAANHQVIGTSQLYESAEARDHGIASVKENAPAATVHDKTT